MATVDPDVAAAALAARDARKSAPAAVEQDTPAEPEAPVAEAAPEPDPVETKPDTASDGLKADLAKERKERQALQAELKALRDGSLSEAESLRREAEAVKNELAELKLANLKRDAALGAGLPASAVRRLQGSTAEELEADAKELAKLLGVGTKTAKTPDAAKTSGTPRPSMNDALRRAAGLK